MKQIKYVFLALMLFAASGVFAQSAVFPLYSNVASGVKQLDTITNAGTVTMTSARIDAAAQQTTIVYTFTKLTGTVAGSATLQGSIDGVNFVTVAGTSAYTVTDVASQTASFVVDKKPYLYWRVSTTGSGTSTYTVKGNTLVVTPTR